jgi:ABC-type antimicrobial peptide transport system permease subunit
LTGLTVGIASAYGVSRFIESLLFDVPPHDPRIYGICAALIAVVALAAAAIPAFRASRDDPMVALRYE